MCQRSELAPKPRLSLTLTVATTLTLVVAGPSAAQLCDCWRDPDLGYRYHLHKAPAQPVPQHVGQDTLGAVQEVVGLLLADPNTDWSRVSIARLRDYLADLDTIMLRAEVAEREVDGGLEITVGGGEAITAAVRRRVPEHARTMDGFRGWRAAAREEGGRVVLRLTTDDPAEVAVLRGLGFYGFLASGVHYPHRLLSVARGQAASAPRAGS